MTLEQQLDQAFGIGLYQHRDEIADFCVWASTQGFEDAIEIGALHGGSAWLLSQLMPGKITSIDLPDGPFGGAHHHYDAAKCVERALKINSLTEGRVSTVLGDSQRSATRDYVSALHPGGVDLVFIDADHSYEGVKRDYELYAPLVKCGGWVAFHDIVTSKLTKEVGCHVDKLWAELTGEKIEFNRHKEWGGIGVIRQGRLQ